MVLFLPLHDAPSVQCRGYHWKNVSMMDTGLEKLAKALGELVASDGFTIICGRSNPSQQISR
jgi:hypothetical protein